MNNWSRRSFLLSAGAGATAACSGGTNSGAGPRIDNSVTAAVSQMQSEYPFTTDLINRAAGVLGMPKISKAGFVFGGSYGEGSLLIGSAPVDYYSVAAASFGLQAGAQQYSSALFFMDSEQLQLFRGRAGWTLGADLEFTVLDDADNVGIDNNTYKDTVYALVFNQSGLLIGASIEGSKYSRIVR